MSKENKSDEQEQSFAEAMQGITLHSHNKADLKKPVNKLNNDYRRKAALAEEEKVIDGLSDEAVSLVHAEDELLFANPGVQLRLLKRLKQGHLPWQEGLDLHGYTVEQARNQLSRFIFEARKNDARCVLVVHGKANSQSGQSALLKSYVNEWLKRLNGVLAFCSAQAKDGGAGALYVLLKKDNAQHNK